MLKKFTVIFAIIVAIFVFMAINKIVSKQKETPSTIENVEETPSFEESLETEEEAENEDDTEAKKPNALDVLAPGYNKAYDRLQNVQDLRNQALEEQQKEIDNLDKIR